MIKTERKHIKAVDEIVVKCIAYVVMTMLALFAVLPLLMLFSASITSADSLAIHGYGFFPREISFAAYEYLWAVKDEIGQAYLNTVIVTVVGTFLSIMITSMLAYGLAQKNIPGQGIVMILLIVSMLFNGGLVSSYITWTTLFNIRNTLAALIFPNFLMSGFTVILVMSYYRSSISPELLEAARIDGAGEFSIFLKIVLPLSTPILATIGLMSAIMYWNDWTNGFYYIDDRHSELYTIQLYLNQINKEIEFLSNNPSIADKLGNVEFPTTSARMAIAFIGILPILVAYPFFQKYFAAGLTLGGVKG